MIGYAITHGKLFLPKKVCDHKIPETSNDYKFFAILKDNKGEISMHNLTKDDTTSQEAYFAMFKNANAEKKYVCGIIAHTARVGFYSHQVSEFKYEYSLPTGSELWNGARDGVAYFDTYEMIAKHMQQKFEAFKSGGKDEKSTGLLTMKELLEKQQKALDKFKSLWKGTGEQLGKNYYMYVLTQDRRSGTLGFMGGDPHPRNLQQQFTYLAGVVFKDIIKADKDYMMMVFVKETGPLWCSEGELTEEACQRMIGGAINQGAGWFDVSFYQKARDKYIPKIDEDYQYIAYVASAKDGKVSRVNLTNDWDYAQSAYNNLFKGGKDREYNVGVIAHSASAGFWGPMSRLTGGWKDLDSFACYVKYMQTEEKLWTKTEISEKNANMNYTTVINKYLEEKWKASKDLYKGTGDQLFKKYKFAVVTYHKRARSLSQIYMEDH